MTANNLDYEVIHHPTFEKNGYHFTHRTERIIGISRTEYYETADGIKYEELYDDLTGKMVSGKVKMFGGIEVRTVYDGGNISLKYPLDIVNSHKSMMDYISDLKKIDAFLSAILDNY
jgi:hypothetical protein